MLVALGWVALGLAIAAGGWRMDRLAQMNIEPWSAPGLVPGVLGVLIAALGAVLAWRERGASRGAPPASVDVSTATTAPVATVPTDAVVATDGRDHGTQGTGELRRVVPILVLVLAWVLGALGRGLPFVATSATLVLAWIALLRWRDWRASGSTARGLGTAAAIAAIACTAVATLFQDVFLVRLP
jgi:hypothetical protein